MRGPLAAIFVGAGPKLEVINFGRTIPVGALPPVGVGTNLDAVHRAIFWSLRRSLRRGSIEDISYFGFVLPKSAAYNPRLLIFFIAI
jgi:hypothetical protein